MDRQTSPTRVLLAALAIAALCAELHGEPVTVRHKESDRHESLILRTVNGTPIADGDFTQTVRGDRVTSRVSFHFKDGSLHEETATFSQQGSFRLLSDHLIQKGPAFPSAVDLSIDTPSGQVTVHSTRNGGQEQTESERFDLPVDLANGLVQILLKNVSGNAPPKSLSYIAATPKPRLVKLVTTSAKPEQLAPGRATTHYVLKVDIGGMSGVLAPWVGKQPPDVHVWIQDGTPPAFVRADQPLYVGGPVWRIQLN